MQTLGIEEFLDAAKNRLLIDVRSPAEFARAHIPGALSVPLFSDEERAVVGTLYKESGRERAVERGLSLAGSKLETFYKIVRDRAPNRKLAVHCWRGGMRSSSMGRFFCGLGFDVVSLQGGYKSFRRYVLESLQTWRLPLVILGGFTGSGKTELLQELQNQGEAVVDLEALACHKGSAFGVCPDCEQPTQEHFENLLFMEICTNKDSTRIWMEDESAHIGRCQIPPAIFSQMRVAPLLKIELPREQRAKRLAREYAVMPREYLRDATRRIQKRLGGLRTKHCLELLERGDLEGAAFELLEYYDRTYSFGQGKRDPKSIRSLSFSGFEITKISSALLKEARQISLPRPPPD